MESNQRQPAPSAPSHPPSQPATNQPNRSSPNPFSTTTITDNASTSSMSPRPQIDTYRPNSSTPRSRSDNHQRGAPPDRDRDLYIPNYDSQRRNTTNDYGNERGRGGSSSRERGMMDRRSHTRSSSPPTSFPVARQPVMDYQRPIQSSQDWNSRDDNRGRSYNGDSWGRRRDGNYGGEQQTWAREGEFNVEGLAKIAEFNHSAEMSTNIREDNQRSHHRGSQEVTPTISNNDVMPAQQQDLRKQAPGPQGNKIKTPVVNRASKYTPIGNNVEQTAREARRPRQATSMENAGLKRPATQTPLARQLPSKTPRTVEEAQGHARTDQEARPMGELMDFEIPGALFPPQEQLFQQPSTGNIDINQQQLDPLPAQFASSVYDAIPDRLLEDVYRHGLGPVLHNAQEEYRRTYREYPGLFTTFQLYVKEVEYLRNKVAAQESTISQMSTTVQPPAMPVAEPEFKSNTWYEQQHQADQKKIGELFIQASSVPNLKTKITQLETRVASEEAAKLTAEEERRKVMLEQDDARKSNAVWGLMALRAGGVEKLEEAVNRSYVDGMKDLEISKPKAGKKRCSKR